MTATYIEALDELQAMFSTGWIAGAPPIVGVVPFISWPGLERKDPPESDKYYTRFSQQTSNEEQSNLKGVGLRRYTIEGFLFIQIFAPLSDTEGVDNARQLAVMVRDIYKGKQTVSSIFLRNARIQEIGSDDKWYQINVVVDFEHDYIS